MIGFVLDFGLASGGRSAWRLGFFRVRDCCEADDSTSDMSKSSVTVLARGSKTFDVGTVMVSSDDVLSFLVVGLELGFGMKLGFRGRKLKSFVDCVPRSGGGNIDVDDDDEPLPAAIFALLLLFLVRIFISTKTHREDACEVWF